MKSNHLKLASTTASSFTPDQLILVVDHYRVGQRIALMQLQTFGLSAHVVISCREAIRALKKHHYALVLIGCGMPICSGSACTRFVRKEDMRLNLHTTVVGVTAHASGGDKDRCLALGMDDLLAKPITLGDMHQMLSRHLKIA
jgi:CheY-like chemotaxis protein